MEYRSLTLMVSMDLAHTVRLQGRLACLRLLLAPLVLALALGERVLQTHLPVLPPLEVLAVNGPLEMLLTTMQTTGAVRIIFTFANELLLNDLQDIMASSRARASRAKVLKESLFSRVLFFPLVTDIVLVSCLECSQRIASIQAKVSLFSRLTTPIQNCERCAFVW